jgi:voltage-gated potassium channel
MFSALRAMLREPEGKIILIWAVLQVIVGTVVFRWLEGWSIINSLYFSVVTLATVGYGDLHPTTDAAKLFTIVYIVFGLGVLASFISELTKHRAEVIAQFRERQSAPAQDDHRDRPSGSSPGRATAGDAQPDGDESR